MLQLLHVAIRIAFAHPGSFCVLSAIALYLDEEGRVQSKFELSEGRDRVRTSYMITTAIQCRYSREQPTLTAHRECGQVRNPHTPQSS